MQSRLSYRQPRLALLLLCGTALTPAVAPTPAQAFARALTPSSTLHAQLGPGLTPYPASLAPDQTKPPRSRKGRNKLPAALQRQPDIAIPVTPLGFAPPALFYLGDRLAQLSLNFLDEDSLLFTFRVPGLIARERPAPDHSPSGDEQHTQRNFRAVVLSLPSGKITAEALWQLHDYAPYIWTLKDRRFVLRDRNSIQIGDASLHLEPFLRFPGIVKSVEFDPQQRLLIAGTSEVVAPEKTAAGEARSAPIASSGSFLPNDFGTQQPGNKPTPEIQSLLRIFRMDTREIMLFSHVPGVVHLAVDGEGYYETLRGRGPSWLILYRTFSGATFQIAQTDSSCNPALDVPAPGFVLASACLDAGGRRLTVFHRVPDQGLSPDRNQRPLWEQVTPPTHVWPLLGHASGGQRFVRATLEVSHPVGPTSPLDSSDIRGQSIQVYDVATGNSSLTLSVNPVLDGGGNFALSPSGNRIAVLNGGDIQVYNLPALPPLVPVAAPKLQAP